MLSCIVYPCRLCFNTFPGLKHISKRILLNNSYVIASKNYSNNLDDTLTVSASANHTSNSFNEFYRFPGIRLGFFLQKLKWQQTILASVAVPSSIVLYFSGFIDFTWMIGVIVPGVSLTLYLYGASAVFTNAVGFLYLSKDETTLKISYLDFWGKRLDEEFPVEDVMPFLDAPRPPTDSIYKQLVFYSSDSAKFKLFLKFGQITDKDKFGKVFGPLE